MFLSLTIDKGNSYLTIGCVHEYYVRWNIKITYENISIFMLLFIVLLSFSLILGELTAEVPSCYKVWGTSTTLYVVVDDLVVAKAKPGLSILPDVLIHKLIKSKAMLNSIIQFKYLFIENENFYFVWKLLEDNILTQVSAPPSHILFLTDWKGERFLLLAMARNFLELRTSVSVTLSLSPL